jgi:2-methylcitrate dehydratase
MSSPTSNVRPAPDKVIVDIANYVERYRVKSALAYETAHYCLIDSIGCAFEALGHPECTKLLGPSVPGIVVPKGARVPGTAYVLDPVTAAFNIGALIRWLDYNDAFYGETVLHPSDTLGGILATADWLSRTRVAQGRAPLLVRDVLEAAIKTYEIAGVLALENDFTWDPGLDHGILIKVANAAVLTRMLGGTREEVINAVSNAWIDGHALLLYRRKGHTGSRKSWAASDAGSRGVWLAMMAVKGEMGYPAALTARTWGFYDALFAGKAFKFQRPYGSYTMENVQFKIACPTAFHLQTAAEMAIRLHPAVKDRIDDIAKVELWAHKHTVNYLNRVGPLQNYADRDHCLQYVVARGLMFGSLVAEDYEDDAARDPRIDPLREKMTVREDRSFSRGFHDPKKRSNGNAIRVHFKDGSRTERVDVEYALGHPKRRADGIPVLIAKFERNVARVFAEKRRRVITRLCLDRERLAATPVSELFDLLAL